MDAEAAELQALLVKLRLEKFTENFKTLGVESKADLAYLEDSDLEKLGLPLVPRRKLLEAAGGQWRHGQASGLPSAPSDPPSPKPAPVTALPPVEEPPKSPSRGAGGSKETGEHGPGAPGGAEDPSESATSEELQQLLRDLRASNGGPMQEILFVRLHQQLLEDVRIGLYLNIREDFATVNCLDLSSRSKLAGLPARVALRTMGLLGTGNSFYMEGIKKPAAALATRSNNAKLKGMEPYQDWVKLLEGFVAANKLSNSTKEALEALTRDQALKVMGFTSELRFLAGPVYRGEAELEVRTRLWAVKSQAMMVPVLPRKGDDTRSRSPRGSRTQAPVPASVTDQFPNWKRYVQSFIELNDLDQRSAEMLQTSSQLSALQVMGLLGTENSFLLRGVRQPGAVVAARLKKVPESVAGREPFAQLAKLMEDFITANRLTGDVAEKFRGLPREQALQVMGFAGDQELSFLIKEGSADEVRQRMAAALRR